jgi:REP element-mobilizing transposase RayT
MNEPLRPRRRTLRAPAHDYASPGAYFITVVTQGRACHFGSITNEVFVPAPACGAVSRVWNALPSRFPSVVLDEFVVMPNHVHGLLWIADVPLPQRSSLGAIVGAFKSLAAREVNAAVKRTGSLWQRYYYERIVRNEAELGAIRQYILDNPLRWALDAENPER